MSLSLREDDVKIPNKGFAIFGWEKIYDVFILVGFMDQNVMSSWVVMIAGVLASQMLTKLTVKLHNT